MAKSPPLSELVTGSFVVTDAFADAPDEIAFRTLIHIDGDICTSVATRALALPDFAAQLDAHTRHVGETIASHRSFARNLITRLSRALGLVSPLAYIAVRLPSYGRGRGLEPMLVEFGQQILTESIGLALSFAVGLALTAGTRVVIQRLARRALGKIGAS